MWQLRVDGRRQAVCGLAVGDPPSAGRLTTRAVAPPAPDDPCILPPASGYRGLENRLYRIEIHAPGPLGTAAFKWSRDNGSIVSTVRAITVSGTETTLSVNRIGRDQFLRFRIGDWVSVTDDHRELHGASGEMVLIVDIDEANRQIVVDRAIPTGAARAFGATDAEIVARHTRVQKWDQTTAANPALDPVGGLIATGAGPIPIEAGIEIEFGVAPGGGEFRIGDYWVFWARTATAEIEELTDAPPRGILHHYLQLAAISGGAVTDCRPPPPTVGDGECCCTIIVAPGEDIQAGIDALPPQGGCVCLKAGLHLIRAPLRIARGNIALTAESPGTIVRSAGAGPVLYVGNPAGARIAGIDVLGIAFEANAPGQTVEGVVSVAGAQDVRIDQCTMRGIESRNFIGVALAASDRVSVTHCDISQVLAGIWVRIRCEDFVADGNRIDLRITRDGIAALAGILVQQSASPCRVSRNLVEGALLGIVVNDLPFGDAHSLADRSFIAENLVDLPLLPGESVTSIRLAGIDCAAAFCSITGNKLRYRHYVYDAIRVSGALCGVTGNALFSGLKERDFRGPIAIRIGATPPAVGPAATPAPVLGGVVSHNFIAGAQHGIVVTAANDLVIEGNILESTGGGIGFGILATGLGMSRLIGNRMRGALGGAFLVDGRQNRITGNDIRDGTFGLSLLREWGPAIDANRLDALAQWGIAGFQLSGRCEITGNRITACGRAMSPIARAVSLIGVAGEAHIVGNEILDTGSVTGAVPTTAADYGIAGDLILEARVADNLVTYSNGGGRDPQREDRALVMRGLLDLRVTDNVSIGFAIQIHGNKFIGAGRTALVELQETPFNNGFIRFERVLFDQNYCLHIAPSRPDDRVATVSLRGRAASASGNHIKATTRNYFSFNFNGTPGPCIGNVVAGPTIQHADFPAPFNAFNMIQF
ncbi:MAG: uncharacterized protein JWM38_1112 [Sphingomonas bacterium]|nr:uncharacterized protein [Sphingomonas bacterium]